MEVTCSNNEGHAIKYTTYCNAKVTEQFVLFCFQLQLCVCVCVCVCVALLKPFKSWLVKSPILNLILPQIYYLLSF